MDEQIRVAVWKDTLDAVGDDALLPQAEHCVAPFRRGRELPVTVDDRHNGFRHNRFSPAGTRADCWYPPSLSFTHRRERLTSRLACRSARGGSCPPLYGISRSRVHEGPTHLSQVVHEGAAFRPVVAALPDPDVRDLTTLELPWRGRLGGILEEEHARVVSVSFKTSSTSTGMLRSNERDAQGRTAMRIGIGLPAAIPGSPPTAVGEWAGIAEASGFASLGVIDRLVYDNLDPLVALGVAAARTERVELLTTVLNVPWRRNAVVLAKQLASLDRVSGGRLTAGLGLGGWADDHEVVGPAAAGTGATMDEMLATMLGAWSGGVGRGSAQIPPLPARRPGLLFGGVAPASFRRAARFGDGWVAPSFGSQVLASGVDAIREAWRDAGRQDEPRVVVERYFSFGDRAEHIAHHYLHHYYGPDYLDAVTADTVTTARRLEHELRLLSDVGADDVVLLPCDADARQIELLAGALDDLLVGS